MSQGGGKKRKLVVPSATVPHDTHNNARSTTESDLLASLGLTMQNMEDYEQDVLKTAEFGQTPRLSGLGGFPPSLVSLVAPSGHALSDVPHFQTLLTHVRQRLVQQPHHLPLLLQQQMLLHVIHTATQDAEACVRPHEEQRHEQLRRQRFRRSLLHVEAATVSRTPRAGTVDLGTTKKPPKSALKRTFHDPTLENDERMAAQRLEEIKKQQQQQQQKTVVFASSSTATAAATRRRMGIQKRRIKAVSDEEETEEELQQRKDHLKKLREVREKRRETRRRKWLATNASPPKRQPIASGERKEQDDSDEEEEEMDFAGCVTDSAAGETSERPALDIPTQPPSIAAASLPPSPLFQSRCPLCQEEVEGISQEALDECLSRHMEDCQTSRRRTRASRQSPRRAAGVVKNYAEDDDTNNSMAEEDSDDDEAVVPALDEIDDNDDDKILGETGRLGEEEEDADDTPRVLGSDGIPSQTPPLDDFEEEDYEDRVDEWIESGIDRMRVMKERDEAESPPGEEVYDGGLTIPAWVNDSLFPYQRTGLQWMWELHRQQAGGIIGDEMGLGKTVQLCAFLGSMAACRRLKSILVIAPATILQHWLSELKVWAPGIRRILIHQSAEGGGGAPLSSKRTISPDLLRTVDSWLKDSRRHRLFEAIDEDDYNRRDPSSFCGTAYAFVTTYENLRRHPNIWTQHPWSYVVMDEAQKIRNPDADITLVCKRLRTPHRLALSGTPIQNDLRELWSLFDFAFPGRLGTLPAFENEFADPIKRGGYSNASPMQVQLAYRCALVLRDLINPYLLRRLKKDVKEVSRMPGKKEQVLFCRLSNRQRVMYEAFLQSDQVKQVMRGSTQLLGAITMLRKICNHPDLVCPPGELSLETFIKKGSFNEEDLYQQEDTDDDRIVSDEEEDGDSVTDRSGKLEVLAKILPLWKEQGHRVLIFCQWKKMLNIIQRFTESQGWKFGRLDGNTNVASRQRLVDRFNSDDSYFGMLMTTRTGGVGLNLTGANRIVLYDPDWNPQTDAQARERAWRFGQEREVTIYRLISAGTVEEKIYQRQIFKTALSNRILQDPRQRRLFSQKDLKDLFSLRVDSGSVASGSEGITETGVLTHGEGYVNPDQDEEKSDKDGGATLQSVLRSKGLAGVFDHDLIESNKVSQSASVREMEENAKKVARAAVSALKESVAGHDAYIPTWTGADEIQGGRFGENRAGGAASIVGSGSQGMTRSTSSAKGSPSSSSLLESIRQRNEAVETEGRSGLSKNSTKEYTALLQRIRTFVRRRVPTTNELLREFSSIKSYDAAVFRRLLKSVAAIKDGQWHLKRP